MYCGADPQRAFYFATPALVFRTLFADLLDGSLLVHSGITAFEALAGFVLGNLVGTALGLSLWYSELLARVSRPYLVALGCFAPAET